jgi:hypothetical protein
VKTFRAFNLTDLETPELRAQGMVNKPLVIGAVIVQPGQYADVPDNTMTRQQVNKAVIDGLLSVGSLPPKYALLKARLQQAKKLPPTVTPVAPKPRVKTFFHKMKKRSAG